jgi:hypothetical protein
MDMKLLGSLKSWDFPWWLQQPVISQGLYSSELIVCMWAVVVRVEHFIGPHTVAESLVSRRKAAVLNTEEWPLPAACLSLC